MSLNVVKTVSPPPEFSPQSFNAPHISTSTSMPQGRSSPTMSADSNNSSTTSPSPPQSVSHILSLWTHVTSFLAAAMFWLGYGFNVIPIVPGSKITSEKWDPWLTNLDSEKVYNFLRTHKEHEVGFIVGDDVIVFDADGPESVAAIRAIEDRFNIYSKLVVKTSKGEHHYFRRPAGSIAKSDSHCSEKHPSRLDIKTGRALVILPISTGKSILTMTAENKDDLSEVSQDFIDAVYEHNGRPAPSAPTELQSRRSPQTETDEASLQRIESLLNSIDPDCGYQDWFIVGSAIFYETSGREEGLVLFDKWSKKGNKYHGRKEIEQKWESFRHDIDNPVTIGTLIKMAKDGGADVAAIMRDDRFEVCEYELVYPDSVAPEKASISRNPLEKYFLRDIAHLEKMATAQMLIFGDIVLLGQATVIYAKMNTGKTLILLFLIIEGIKAGKFDPSKLIYINMDDDSNGLAVKARIAEEYGFEMVADGYHGFEAKAFRAAMEKMIETDNAHGYIIILDTLKKFVNTMSKEKSSDFSKIVRQFVLKGGTIVALSHVNKNPGSDGKPIYSGTTDIIDDFDCGYTLMTVSEDRDKFIKVVEFENIKRRGNVAISAAYSYALESDITYNELLLSVHEVDPEQLAPIKHEAELLSDSQMITVIESCIKCGVSTKMKLAEAAAQQAKVSKRNTLKVIEKYTGDDPALHRWTFEVQERGAKVYVLLNRPGVQPPGQDMAAV